MLSFPLLASVLASLLALSHFSELQAGTIVGKVEFPRTAQNRRIAVEKYSRSISGKVAPPPARIAGVWLTRDGLSSPASPPPVVLDQRNYQFGKSLLLIPRGTTVLFPNEDPHYHNVFSLSRAKQFDLGRYKKGERPTPSVTFDQPALIKLRCEIHEHMQALILVVDSPYYTTSDQNGNFTLSDIPAGTYTLHAQLNRRISWKTTITVSTDRTTKIQLPLSRKQRP